MDLDHDAVATAEGVGYVGHLELDVVWLVRDECHWLFDALAVLASEGFSSYELLVASHFDWGGGDWFWIVSGVDVD